MRATGLTTLDTLNEYVSTLIPTGWSGPDKHLSLIDIKAALSRALKKSDCLMILKEAAAQYNGAVAICCHIERYQGTELITATVSGHQINDAVVREDFFGVGDLDHLLINSKVEWFHRDCLWARVDRSGDLDFYIEYQAPEMHEFAIYIIPPKFKFKAVF